MSRVNVHVLRMATDFDLLLGRRGEQHEELLRLRSLRDSSQENIARAHAARIALQARLVGDPTARASQAVLQAAVTNAPKGHADDGHAVTGVEQEQEQDVDGRERALEKAVYFEERVRLLQECARQKGAMERAREMRARLELHRQEWALAQMAGKRRGLAVGSSFPHPSEHKPSPSGSKSRANGDDVTDDGGEWPSKLFGVDKLVSLVDPSANARSGDQDARAERERRKRGGVPVAMEELAAERAREKEALKAQRGQLEKDKKDTSSLLQSALTDKRVLLQKVCLSVSKAVSASASRASSLKASEIFQEGYLEESSPREGDLQELARLASQLLRDDSRMLAVMDEWQRTWAQLQCMAKAAGMLQSRCDAEQEALDEDTKAVLSLQQDNQRQRRMLFHALADALLSPDLRDLGFIVRNPDADSTDASLATPGRNFTGRLRRCPVVTRLMTNSAAAAAGVQVGDEIVAIDGHDTTDMPALLLMQLAIGMAGTSSRVCLRRAVVSREGRGRGDTDGADSSMRAGGTFTLELTIARAAGSSGGLPASWLESARMEREASAARKQLDEVGGVAVNAKCLQNDSSSSSKMTAALLAELRRHQTLLHTLLPLPTPYTPHPTSERSLPTSRHRSRPLSALTPCCMSPQMRMEVARAAGRAAAGKWRARHPHFWNPESTPACLPSS